MSTSGKQTIPGQDDRARRAFRYAAAGMADISGRNVFHHLVEHIARALDLNYAFIGVLQPGEVERVNVLALYNDGVIEDNFEYDLENTPCRNVIGQRYRYYPDKVTEQFDDPHAKELLVEGYAGIPLYDSHGEVLGVMAVMNRAPLQDPELTEELLRIFSVRAALELERSRTSREAEEKSQQYLAIFNASVDGFVMFDDRGQVVDANAAFKKMHGYDVGHNFAGIDPFEFIPPESHDVYHRFVRTVMDKGHLHIEGTGRRRDGSRLIVDIHGVRMTYMGRPHMLAIARDITEQKQNEANLRRSEDLFRATVDAALDCIVSMDEAGRILEFNPAAEKTFGFKRDEVIGKSVAETIIPTELREAHRRGMAQYLQTRQGPFIGQRIEIQALRASGETFPVELAIDVASSSEGTMFIGYIRDITERKQAEAERARLEAQLRQAQKMEALGQLTGGVAHDFNNILTGIMGYIVMAQEWEAAHRDEKLQRYLERAQKSGQRARDLIQQMLTFSRGQRGEPRALDMQRYVQESIRLLESSLPSTIEIRFDAEKDLPHVMADPVHIGQILMNLCINARDAMRGSGELQISLRKVECRSDCICTSCHKPMAGQYLELRVRDSGEGISRNNLERIFEPFFSTKEVGKGSGMGLAMVHGIVHEYDGHIVVECQPGAGSSFSVMLPLAGNVAGHEGIDESGAHDVPGHRLAGEILLVDDDVSVSEYMQDRLTDWGLTVTRCQNGADAIVQLQRRGRPYAAYILDYSMPKMNGLELAGEIRRRDPAAQIIMYTGYSEALFESDALAQGVRVVLNKPLDDRLLLEQLRAALEQAAA